MIGLSWKVIKAIAQRYNLHRLAIEDLVIPASRNRPKCDWYSDHCFVILPLLKLLDHNAAHKSTGDLDSDASSIKESSFWRGIFSTIMNPSKANHALPDTNSSFAEDPEKRAYNDPENKEYPERNIIRTLQQAYGGPNVEKRNFMEDRSSLKKLDKIVHVEQVAAFLTSEGTVVSFFEISGDDIEPPIIERLKSQGTLLRTSSDASMMLQAIIDAVVDLSFPVIGAYQDTIASLELIVLTDPSVKQSQELYILTSELSLLKGTLAPMGAVITSLRDPQRSIAAKAQSIETAQISEMTRIYLGDVLDHVLLILEVCPPSVRRTHLFY